MLVKVIYMLYIYTPHTSDPLLSQPTMDHSRPPTPPSSDSPSPTHSLYPSRPASRAPSISAGVSGFLARAKDKPRNPKPGLSPPPAFSPVPPALRSKPASINTDGHKFNLKDLLGAGPKVSRKGSSSSKRSDSEAGDIRPRSTAGDSAVSLSQKYGVCQRVAIGKGATSVVRLAHKWDRSEEKLYAVKVRHHRHISSDPFSLMTLAEVPQT